MLRRMSTVSLRITKPEQRRREVARHGRPRQTAACRCPHSAATPSARRGCLSQLWQLRAFFYSSVAAVLSKHFRGTLCRSLEAQEARLPSWGQMMKRLWRWRGKQRHHRSPQLYRLPFGSYCADLLIQNLMSIFFWVPSSAKLFVWGAWARPTNAHAHAPSRFELAAQPGYVAIGLDAYYGAPLVTIEHMKKEDVVQTNTKEKREREREREREDNFQFIASIALMRIIHPIFRTTPCFR